MPTSRGRNGRRRRKTDPVAVVGRRKRAPVSGVTTDDWCSLTWGDIGALEPAGREGASVIGNMIQEAAEKFRARFQREPRLDDPIFFDEEVEGDTPCFRSPAQVKADMIDAMQEAGISGHLVYTFARTGLTLSEHNRKLHSREQLRSWDQAIEEYEAAEEQNRESPDQRYRIDDLVGSVAAALHPMVEREPTVTQTATRIGCVTTFDGAFYRLELYPEYGVDLTQTTRAHVRLLHWCFPKELEEKQPGFWIDLADPQAAAKEINEKLFRQIPRIVRAGFEGYEEKTDDDDLFMLFENAYRRRLLEEVWQAVAADPEKPYYVDEIHVPAVLGDWIHDVGKIGETDDESVAYCLGFISSFLESLQASGVLAAHGIEDWRAHFWPIERGTDATPPDGVTEALPPCARTAKPKPGEWDDAERFTERNTDIQLNPDRALSDDEWTVDDVRRVVLDVRSVGVGGFPRIVDDERWIRANQKLLTDLGPEQYFTLLLRAMHENFTG